MQPYDVPPTVQDGLHVLGGLVRQWRRACGLSQRRLAGLVGVNQSTISRLEAGRLRYLRFRTLARIIGVLHDPTFGLPVRSRSRWA